MKKASKYATIYSVVTQGFIMMVVIAAIGFLIGKYAIKEEHWAAILAVIGALIGLVIFIKLLFDLNKVVGDNDEKSGSDS